MKLGKGPLGRTPDTVDVADNNIKVFEPQNKGKVLTSLPGRPEPENTEFPNNPAWHGLCIKNKSLSYSVNYQILKKYYSEAYMNKGTGWVYLILAGSLFLTGCSKSFMYPAAPQSASASNTAPIATSGQILAYITQWGSEGSGPMQFNSVYGIQMDSHGDLYVPDRMNYRVQKFDSSGNFILQWGTPGSGNSQFSEIQGVCIDSNDNVFTIDDGNKNMQKFTDTGSFIKSWGTYGSGPSQFSSPRGIACDLSNNIYTCDAGNQDIQKFDDNGNYITSWSTNGTWSNNNSNPDGIACDHWGNVYTPDYNNSCVYKYTNTGTFECQIGTPGIGPGQCGILSCGVCVDLNGIVYVADFTNQRVSEFNVNGTYLCQWGNTAPHALPPFDYLCLGQNGKMYIMANNSCWVFGP